MTRVLFLTESFHPVLGGGEQHVRRLGAALVRDGWGATVVTRRSEAAFPPAEDVDGIRVVRVPPAGDARRGKFAMVIPALRAVAAERARFDVLVVRGTRVLGLPGLVLGRALDRPVVLQAEVNGELSGEVYTWGKTLPPPVLLAVRMGVRARNVLLRDADAFVAMSRLIRDEFVAAGVDPWKVHLIPHGVDVARFRPASPEERATLRARWGFPPEACVIAYVGRLLRGKGLEDLVAAFARLAARAPEAHLALVGSGAGQALSNEEALRRSVQEAGLGPRVTFTGRVEAPEDVLRAVDVFAFPSRFEGLGIALVEAAACGVPAVGTRTGGIVDVIEDGVSGLLVPPGDVAALEAALSRLFADPALRAGLGQGAVRVARARFDEKDALLRYETLFAELVARRRGRRRPEAVPGARAPIAQP